MGDKSAIEWTDATWNPATGCTKVSPGCANCYIERTPPFRVKGRKFDAKGTTGILMHWERLGQPLRWKKPRHIFVNSLSDLFHEEIPNDFINYVFAAACLCPQHTFQILTKRPQRMRQYVSHELVREEIADAAKEVSRRNYRLPSEEIFEAGPVARAWKIKAWPLPNVWLGVTVENQRFADERIPLLLQTPAAVRFVSYEPALGPVDFGKYLEREWVIPQCMSGDGPERSGPKLDWVICGGESGPGARPMHPDWARSVRDQCQAARVPFFFKQWGEWLPAMQDGDGKRVLNCSNDAIRCGKKAAGRILDGLEWNEALRTAEKRR